MEIVILALCIVIAVLSAILLFVLFGLKTEIRSKSEKNDSENAETVNAGLIALTAKSDSLSRELRESQSSLRSEIGGSVTNSVSRLGDSLRDEQEKQQKLITAQLEKIERQFEKTRGETLETLHKMQAENTGSMDRVREENQKSLDRLREENKKSLELINETVNEKLQKTLNDRISQSFEIVNKRLGEVYEGLGEMKQVASGVTDLKKVLSNVKARGIMGEIRLDAILSEILTPEQYGEQVSVSPASGVRVDFAVKLPGKGDDDGVWLPIDSKFPSDKYQNVLDAYEKGDGDEIKSARKLLESEIKQFAKSISQKYIDPPHTTDFAIMFLPFEGLYAEVINLGLVELLQREYKINIAGPSTMAAMLNSLQMGFRTLAVQKKSGEVWKILEQAKKEFSNFESVLEGIRKKLGNVDAELEKLVGTRTRAINRSLREINISREQIEGGGEAAGLPELPE